MLEYTRIEDYDLNPSNGLSDIQNIRLDAEDERLLSSLYEKYRSIMASDFGAIAGILLRDFRLLAEKERIAEKTPTHFLYLPPIFRFFPDARVVFISRDAREVLASYVCTFSYRHISWRRAVRHIHGLCEQARNVAKFYADDVRVLNVVYDELLTETTTTMRRIYGFLGVAPSADLDTKLAGVQRTASHSDKLTEAHKRYIDELLT
jgi:hypothetical protein